MGALRDRLSLFAFTLLMTAVWLHPPLELPAQQSLDETSRKKLREADQRALELMRKTLEKPESRSFDVKLRAEGLGKDPARIVAFVQKDIRFEPYPGLQRGPAGVLIAGAGNAIDKAFLLRDLLRAAGLEARMTRASLTRQRAAEAVKSALQAIQNRPANRFAGPYGEGLVDPAKTGEICRQLGVTPEEMDRLSRKFEEGKVNAWKGVQETSTREQGFLQGQIEAAKLKGPELSVMEDLIGSATAHARVQWKGKGAAAWTSADPCFSEAASLAGVTAADEELDPQGLADRFTLSLVLERKSGADRKTQEVVKYDTAIFDTLLEPIQFSIVPTDPKLPEPGVNLTREDAAKTLAGYREFVAAVMVADRPAASMVFDYDGLVSKPIVAAGKIGGGAAGTAKKVADLFNPDKKEEEKSTLESLWVDLSATREGKTLWKQRRSILSTGERATWCPLLQWDLFLQSQEVSSNFVQYIHLAYRVGNADLVQGVEDWVREGAKTDAKKVLQTKGYTYPVDLLDFARARQAYGESRFGAKTWMYFDRPNLFMSGRSARLRGAPDKLCLCYSMDLVENGVLEVETATGRVDRGATTDLGVFCSVQEESMVGRMNQSEGAFGAVSFFERARAQARATRFVGSKDAAGLAEAGVPKAEADWIVANSEEGSQVLVAKADGPNKEGAYAWWSFDPRTGRTVGRISGGRGGAEILLSVRQDLEEEGFILTWSSRILCAITALIQVAFHKVGEAASGAVMCVFLAGVAHGIGGHIGEMIEVLHMVLDFFEIQHAPHGE